MFTDEFCFSIQNDSSCTLIWTQPGSHYDYIVERTNVVVVVVVVVGDTGMTYCNHI